MDIENFFREGIVSSTDPQHSTAKVVFPSKTNAAGKQLVSDNLTVLQQGSKRNKYYWMPDVGEAVLCVMMPNGSNAGYILGTHYNADDQKPPEGNQRKRVLHQDGELVIECTGNMTIRAAHVSVEKI